MVKPDQSSSAKRAAILGWALVGVYFILATAGLILLYQPGMPKGPFDSRWEVTLQATGTLVLAVIGGLIISRHPRHPLGWVIVLVSILLAMDLFAFGYAAYGLLVNPGSLPGTLGIAILADDGVFIAQIGLVLGLLLFPDGRFLSSRWRTATWFLIITSVIANIIWLITPGPLLELPMVDNPIGVNSDLYAVIQPFAAFVSNILIPLSLLASMIALFLRFRHGDRVQKQQIKWFVFGTTPFIVGAIIQLTFHLTTTFASVAFITIGLITTPVAIAIAIFKYRLYDIDLIINRTLVYGTLTIGIAVIYTLVVTVFSYFIQANSDLAGLSITLIIIVLSVRPMRAKAQRLVDRLTGSVQDGQPSEMPHKKVLKDFEIKLSDKQVREEPALLTPVNESQGKFRNSFLVKALSAVSIGLTLVAFIVSLNHALATGDLSRLLTHIVFLGPVSVAFTILGFLVASRHPQNAIGWIFLTQGLLYALTLAFGVYDDLGSLLPTGGSPPGAAVVGWFSSWIWVPTIILPTAFLFLLFPNGRLPTPRWRPVFWAAVFGLILASLGEAIPRTSSNEATVELIGGVGFFLVLIIGIGGGVVAFSVRFRRSHDVEREQLKWLAYALVMMLLFLVLGSIISYSVPQLPFLEDFLIVLTNVAILGIATGASVAILRYRLYNIDLIINRTLVFSTLTGSIALLYGLVVGTTGYFLQTKNDLAGLLITGAIALVVFRPLNVKLQQGVERIIPGNRPQNYQNLISDELSITTDPLPSSWLMLAQIVWVAFAIAAIAMIIASLPHYAAKFGGQLEHATNAVQPPGTRFFAAASGVASLVSALLSLGLSAVLFRQKFNKPIVMLLSFFLLIYGIVMGGPLEAAASYWLGSASYAAAFQGLLLSTPLIALLLLFPNSRFVPAWTRWVLLLSLPWNVGLFLLVPFDAESFNRSPLLSIVVVILFISFGIIGIYAQIYRYLRAATNNERQQIRWAIYGFALWLTYMFISSIPYYYLTALPPDAPTPWWGPASELGWWLSLNILPICLTIAITRYQLWDIDLVINRTLVYGILTISVLVLYALVVGGMGLYFRAEDNIVLPLLATGLAAILFHPLRLRLQRGINRLMYGDRDQPFDVLARLGERLENTLSPEMVYPTIVETVSQALKLPYAAVNVWLNGRWETAESYGKPVADPVIYPLTHQGDTVGQLLVARRTSTEPFGPADERILRNIARQAGAAVHAVQLVADLQQSRHQLVTAREEERRRLRRDLHDGIGPHLASQTLTIDAIEKLLDRDPERARALLQDLKTQSQTAVKDIRRVVYNLRPPALDELGLIGALNEGAARQSQNGLQVTVDAPAQLPPLPAAVEVAAYRIAQEAITNVVRHAQAHNCFVRLGLEYPGKETRLRLEVEDDGQGLPTDYLAGVGFQSMRERAAELGGFCHIETVNGSGVLVTAVFPFPVS